MTSFREAWRQDLSVARHEDMSAAGLGTLIGSFLSRSAFCAVFLYRLASAFMRRGGRVSRGVAHFLTRLNTVLHACDIDPTAVIGPGLHLPHPVGVVIGAARIGAHVTLLQNVTLGVRDRTANSFLPSAFPSLGDDVYVGAGAILLGGITIGSGAQIGAGAVVLDSVPEGALAVGVPARVKETLSSVAYEQNSKKIA